MVTPCSMFMLSMLSCPIYAEPFQFGTARKGPFDCILPFWIYYLYQQPSTRRVVHVVFESSTHLKLCKGKEVSGKSPAKDLPSNALQKFGKLLKGNKKARQRRRKRLEKTLRQRLELDNNDYLTT